NGKYSFIFKNHLDRVANFFSSLKTPDGDPIPFIFRPWHEMDGGWFWWGATLCTPDELKELFRFTIEYLRNEKGLSNMLVAYSPDRDFYSEAEYLTWYPGDDFVDIVAMDNYHDLEGKNGLKEAVEKLRIVADYAKKTGKVAALSETGFNKLGETHWFTEHLWPVLNAPEVQGKIAYTLVWRNYNLRHFFLPPPEHPAAADFKKFTQEEKIWLLTDRQKFIGKK
ncbi:MAG: glycoside hydrolase family 26 protein, partial [Prolixibacteraceae bacterium]|nr:glycoside hydrolase family 26 protein [Prolixibacteraceae bacterium]